MVVECIAKILFKGTNISNDDQEIVQFGLGVMERNFVGFFICCVVGLLFKCVNEGVIFWLLLFPLRVNAGGYHAKTKRKCYLISFIQIVVLFGMFNVMEINTLFFSIYVMVFGSIIWRFAPVDNENKRLDEIEKYIYRKRTRMVIIIEIALFYLSMLFHGELVTRSVLMTLTIASISILMGAVSNKMNRTVQ